MKRINWRTFTVRAPDGEAMLTTGWALNHIAAYSERGLSTDEMFKAGDIRRRTAKMNGKAKHIDLENAEHEYIMEKMGRVLWPVHGQDIEDVIGDIRDAKDPDAKE